MGAAYPKPSALQRSIFVSALVIASGIDIYLQGYVVCRFREFYQDALPGQMLPHITQFILNFQPALVVLTIILLLAGIGILFRARPVWIGGILFLTAIQIIVTMHALFMPMVTNISGIPVAH